MIYILFGLYAGLLSFILFYSFSQLGVLLSFWKSEKTSPVVWDIEKEDLPFVTIQLPIYNERYVVERLMDSVCDLRYPLNKLEIQVLDDSTDECRTLVAQIVEEKKALGFDIKQVIRKKRDGFKAGALKHGLQEAKGEYIAIFDADFLPHPNFLLETLPGFNAADVGMVQTRWGHLNKNHSLLTKLQAFGLDAHFTVEQVGRNRAGHYINFNGTAGIWRRNCIDDAGSWEADTLTEDLDLSYRAQLKNWRFVYLEHVESPAELPINIYPLKSQQFRWTKGAAECWRKNLGLVLRSNESLATKWHAFFHLSNSFLFLAILFSALLSVPLSLVKVNTSAYNYLFNVGGVFLVSLLVLVAFYYTAFRCRNREGWRFLYYFPLFLSVSMGLSLHNSLAVIEGYLGIKSPFVRTPKFNSIGREHQDGSLKQYVVSKLETMVWLELGLAVIFALTALHSVWNGEFGLLPLHVMLSFGFAYVSITAIRYHVRQA